MKFIVLLAMNLFRGVRTGALPAFGGGDGVVLILLDARQPSFFQRVSKS
jgi:hypothetical protein